jgi:SseB protein N-terminal domain
VTTASDDSTTTASPSTEDAIASGMEAGDNAAVLRALATSIALLPQAPPAEGEERPEGAIALPVIEQDGQRYIPVFTSEESLRAAGADPATAVRIPVAQLAANWPSEDVWLAVNPASEDGLGLPPDVVRALPVFAGADGGGAVGGTGPDTGTTSPGTGTPPG